MTEDTDPERADRIAIAQLSPSVDPKNQVLEGVVTLIWPYSASSKAFSILLAESDFRLRRQNGQVRVRFTGPSAEAASKCNVQSGDRIILSLLGVRWEKETSKSTPGSRIEWELHFTDRLILKTQREDAEPQCIDVDHPTTPPGSRPPSPPIPDTSLPSNYVSTPLSFAAIPTQRQTWSTPAFLKRDRLSTITFFGSDYSPFDEAEFQDNNRRKKTKFGRASNQWRFTEQSSSPESLPDIESPTNRHYVDSGTQDATFDHTQIVQDLKAPDQSGSESDPQAGDHLPIVVETTQSATLPRDHNETQDTPFTLVNASLNGGIAVAEIETCIPREDVGRANSPGQTEDANVVECSDDIVAPEYSETNSAFQGAEMPYGHHSGEPVILNLEMSSDVISPDEGSHDTVDKGSGPGIGEDVVDSEIIQGGDSNNEALSAIIDDSKTKAGSGTAQGNRAGSESPARSDSDRSQKFNALKNIVLDDKMMSSETTISSRPPSPVAETRPNGGGNEMDNSILPDFTSLGQFTSINEPINPEIGDNAVQSKWGSDEIQSHPMPSRDKATGIESSHTEQLEKSDHGGDIETTERIEQGASNLPADSPLPGIKQPLAPPSPATKLSSFEEAYESDQAQIDAAKQTEHQTAIMLTSSENEEEERYIQDKRQRFAEGMGGEGEILESESESQEEEEDEDEGVDEEEDEQEDEQEDEEEEDEGEDHLSEDVSELEEYDNGYQEIGDPEEEPFKPILHPQVEVIAIDDSDEDEMEVVQSQTEATVLSQIQDGTPPNQSPHLSADTMENAPFPSSPPQVSDTVQESQVPRKIDERGTSENGVGLYLEELRNKSPSSTPPSVNSQRSDEQGLDEQSFHKGSADVEKSPGPAAQPKLLVADDYLDPRLKNKVLTPMDTQPKEELSQVSEISLRSIHDNLDLPTPQLTQNRSSDILLPASLRSSSPAVSLPSSPQLPPISPPPLRKGDTKDDKTSPVAELQKFRDAAVRSLKPSPRSRRVHNIPISISPWFSPRPSSQIIPDSQSQSEDSESEDMHTPTSDEDETQDIDIDIPDQAILSSNVELPEDAILPAAHTNPSSSQQTAATPIQPPQSPPIGLRTSHAYYAPLSTLPSHFNNSTSTLSLTLAATPVFRANAGPRDYHTTIFLIDPSSLTSSSSPAKSLHMTTAALFRPFHASLPSSLTQGSIIILRNLTVTSVSHSPSLLSTNSSAWAVFTRASPSTPTISGPPLEFGAEERGYVKGLWDWWDQLSSDIKTETLAVAESRVKKMTDKEERNRKRGRRLKGMGLRLAPGMDGGGEKAHELRGGKEWRDDIVVSPKQKGRRGRGRGMGEVRHELRDGKEWVDDVGGLQATPRKGAER
ncbi:MAG: hypothetical protein Q9220_004109 [cf. Caloplaca sp. 1 TL-2023]